MLQSVRICATTLKPIPDRWIARDGCDVVLSATPRELLLLRFEEPGWRITHHERLPGDDADFADAINVHGWRYSATGNTLHILLPADSDDVWCAVYRTLLRV